MKNFMAHPPCRLAMLTFAILAFISGCNRSDPELLVQTNSGPVVGTKDSDLKIWRGIPFAQPPLGSLRWREPLPPIPWTAPLDATSTQPACFQGSWFQEDDDYSGSEDCLYLNVFAPGAGSAPPESGFPVMVWIHGGANIIGSAATYNPSHLVRDQKLIVVTIQYRLASLGWFRHPALRTGSTSAADQSGNFGTLDTIAAMQWVKDNIQRFGGDPHNITIAGESAGGHNVAALMASPLANGLFHKAIIQSGIVSVSDIDAAEQPYPESQISASLSSHEILLALMQQAEPALAPESAKARISAMTDPEIADFLRTRTPSEILSAERKARPEGVGMTRVFPDGYVIPEGGITGAFENPNRPQIPLLIGTNRDETKLFNAMDPTLVDWGQGSGLWAFIDRMPIKIKDPAYYNALSQYGSKFWKLRAVDQIARLLTELGQPVYAYRFDWDDLPAFGELDYQNLIGAGHAIELLFLFPQAMEQTIVANLVIGDNFDEAQLLSSQLRNYWAEFAYFGDPGQGLEHNQTKWPKWDSDAGQEQFMVLDAASDQGLVVSTDALTETDIVMAIINNPALDQNGRCRLIKALTERDGDGISEEAWQFFGSDQCRDGNPN